MIMALHHRTMPATTQRTRYPSTVHKASTLPRLLVSGEGNKKLGKVVKKGKLKGYHIYSLTLEERVTCPSSCHHWTTCYGNNMPFARRVDHTDPSFLERLEAEIATLLAVRGRRGVLVRLHVLGDFFSTDYVDFWRQMLDKHPNLAVWGYTARHWFTDPIGVDIDALNVLYRGRWYVRFSNTELECNGTVPIQTPDQCPPEAFICPEQTGRVKSCATCGACWSTPKNVAFLEH